MHPDKLSIPLLILASHVSPPPPPRVSTSLSKVNFNNVLKHQTTAAPFHYAMELPDMVVMQVFSHESVFSELDLTAFGVPGAVCSMDSVLLLVEARLPASLVAVRTSKTLHSLSRSLPSSWRTFS